MSLNPHSPSVPAGEITSSRFFAASREEVFAAFRDPARLSQWWGPQGFTNVFHQFEFRPGGVWRFTMRGADGAAYEMDQQFVAVVPPERIVVRHFQPAHDFTLDMTLVARDGGTQLTWTMHFEDPAEGERVRAFIIPANEQNFNRLAGHLAQTTRKS